MLKCLLFAFLGMSLSMAQDKLVIKGSDTLGTKMVPQLTEVYKALGNEESFVIHAEGSSTCFITLLEGSAEIGMSSRPVKEKELQKFKAKGWVLKKHVVAYDMIAVIVNKENPLNNLSKKQIESVFTGDVTDWSELGWSEGGEIYVKTRNTSSGTYKTFQKLAMSKRVHGKNTHKLAG